MQYEARWLPKEVSLKDAIYSDVDVPEQTRQGHVSHVAVGASVKPPCPRGVGGVPVTV